MQRANQILRVFARGFQLKCWRGLRSLHSAFDKQVSCELWPPQNSLQFAFFTSLFTKKINLATAYKAVCDAS